MSPERTGAGELGGAVAEAFGDLIDALNDEMAMEISRNPHVKAHVRKAVEVLGGPWSGYLDVWWLHVPTQPDGAAS